MRSNVRCTINSTMTLVRNRWIYFAIQRLDRCLRLVSADGLNNCCRYESNESSNQGVSGGFDIDVSSFIGARVSDDATNGCANKGERKVGNYCVHVGRSYEMAYE